MKDEQMLEWFKAVIWAGRSVEDRLLGMEKAVGSNPIRSIFFYMGNFILFSTKFRMKSLLRYRNRCKR